MLTGNVEVVIEASFVSTHYPHTLEARPSVLLDQVRAGAGCIARNGWPARPLRACHLVCMAVTANPVCWTADLGSCCNPQAGPSPLSCPPTNRPPLPAGQRLGVPLPL